MRPDKPESTSETGNAEEGRASDAAFPRRPAPQERHRPLRLIRVMALVAATALTFIIPPALLKLIMQPVSGWGPRELFTYKTTLALTFWTPIVALSAKQSRSTTSSFSHQCSGSHRQTGPNR